MKKLLCTTIFACSLTAIGEPDRNDQNYGDFQAYKKQQALQAISQPTQSTTYAAVNIFARLMPQSPRQEKAHFSRGLKFPQKGS